MTAYQMTPDEAHRETLRLIVGAEKQLEELRGRMALIRNLLPRLSDIADAAEHADEGGWDGG